MTQSSVLRLTAAAIILTAIGAARPAVAPLAPATIDPMLYSSLTWRNLGPFRAGRVAAVSGAIGQPGVFYAGLPAGGVWKTTSAGETWYPIFDGIKEVSSIGAIEVAPSDPNIIYVGTGDMITGGAINEGNGVYKSTDAGRTRTAEGRLTVDHRAARGVARGPLDHRAVPDSRDNRGPTNPFHQSKMERSQPPWGRSCGRI